MKLVVLTTGLVLLIKCVLKGNAQDSDLYWQLARLLYDGERRQHLGGKKTTARLFVM